nr:Inosose dehydratase [Klebsiella pneumoniae]
MNKDNVKLAIAPIGWTNDDMPELGSENTFQQIVSEMALAGFTGSEVGSKYPRDPAVLKPMLDIRGIQICNAWFSTFSPTASGKTIDEFVNHMNFLHAMGAKVIGCSEQSGSIQGLDKPILGDAKPCFSDEEWQRVAEGYNTLGRLAAEKGCRSVCTTTWAPAFRPPRKSTNLCRWWTSASSCCSTPATHGIPKAAKRRCWRSSKVSAAHQPRPSEGRPPAGDRPVRRDGLSFLDGVKKAPSPSRATG